MKTNSTPLVATTFIALAGTALAAPLPQNWPQLEVANTPRDVASEPLYTYDAATKTFRPAAVRKPVENVKIAGTKPPSRRDTSNNIMGNFKGKADNVKINNDIGNDAGNTYETSTQDSHDTSVKTSLGLFRRDTDNNIMGSAGGRISGLSINNDEGNDAGNVHESSSKDSHDTSIQTSLGLFRRDTDNNIMGNFKGKADNVNINNDIGNDAGNTHETASQDSHDTSVQTSLGFFRRDTDNNIMGSAGGRISGLSINNDEGNDAGNVHESSSKDSHNKSVQTSLGLFRRGNTKNNIMGNAGGDLSNVKINNDIGNDADNTSKDFKQDSHNVAVSTGLDLPIPF